MTAIAPTPHAPAEAPAPAPAGEPGARRRRRRRVRLAIAGGALLAVLGGYTAWTNTHPYRLSASTVVEATPQEVWQVLTDLDAYRRWNPFLVSARGRVAEGATLHLVMRDKTGDSTFDPTVLTVDPGRKLRWLGKIGPGWIGDGEHRFTIERLPGGRVRLTQSERFTGVAVPFARGMLHDNTLPQFRALNRALAERVAALRAR